MIEKLPDPTFPAGELADAERLKLLQAERRAGVWWIRRAEQHHATRGER